eukprot:Nk52_evm1s2382 gene=Nk52_evmTU1s2382
MKAGVGETATATSRKGDKEGETVNAMEAGVGETASTTGRKKDKEGETVNAMEAGVGETASTTGRKEDKEGEIVNAMEAGDGEIATTPSRKEDKEGETVNAMEAGDGEIATTPSRKEDKQRRDASAAALVKMSTSYISNDVQKRKARQQASGRKKKHKREGEYEMEQLLSHIKHEVDGKAEFIYLVQWVPIDGQVFPNSWEPAQNFDDQMLLEYHRENDGNSYAMTPEEEEQGLDMVARLSNHAKTMDAMDAIVQDECDEQGVHFRGKCSGGKGVNLKKYHPLVYDLDLGCPYRWDSKCKPMRQILLSLENVPNDDQAVSEVVMSCCDEECRTIFLEFFKASVRITPEFDEYRPYCRTLHKPEEFPIFLNVNSLTCGSLHEKFEKTRNECVRQFLWAKYLPAPRPLRKDISQRDLREDRMPCMEPTTVVDGFSRPYVAEYPEIRFIFANGIHLGLELGLGVKT